MPVERSEPEVPGFRDYARNDEVAEQPKPRALGLCDYARNDEVEDSTLCSEHRDVMRRAHPCHAARSRSIQKGL